MVVPNSGRYYRWPFIMERLLTQGGLVYPTVLNILVETVVRAVLLEVCSHQEAQHGLVWYSGENNVVFYAYGRRIACHKPIWLQRILAAVVHMFDRVVLQTNLVKTRQCFLLLVLSGFKKERWPISGGQWGRVNIQGEEEN